MDKWFLIDFKGDERHGYIAGSRLSPTAPAYSTLIDIGFNRQADVWQDDSAHYHTQSEEYYLVIRGIGLWTNPRRQSETRFLGSLIPKTPTIAGVFSTPTDILSGKTWFLSFQGPCMELSVDKSPLIHSFSGRRVAVATRRSLAPVDF